MARIGISITKSCAFRNSTQEFTNTYFYEGPAKPDEAGATALINELVGVEKSFHSSLVTFVRGRCWSQTGDKATSEMIAQINLSGTGSTSAITSMDRERAYLFRKRAGNDSRGNPVYFRKWYHSCGQFDPAVGVAANIMENTTGFSAANKTAFSNRMNGINGLGAGGNTWIYCAKSGRTATAGATWDSHNFLEHHQLGDMWRAQ